jgi:hypothetical protein
MFCSLNMLRHVIFIHKKQTKQKKGSNLPVWMFEDASSCYMYPPPHVICIHHAFTLAN